VLLASQPTRGVDIGAAEYIHRRLIEERGRGAAVLALSDRIAVMSEGRVLAVMDRDEATIQRVGLLMAGSEAVA
jgi:simple sugar transport system ATP-binding protein